MPADLISARAVVRMLERERQLWAKASDKHRKEGGGYYEHRCRARLAQCEDIAREVKRMAARARKRKAKRRAL